MRSKIDVADHSRKRLSLAIITTLIIIITTMQASTAAMIEGTAYTYDLSLAKYSIITVDTTPPQQLLLEDGTYNITLPKGTYSLRITHHRNGKNYEDTIELTIVDDGKYTYDFILFPVQNLPNSTTTGFDLAEDLLIPQEENQDDTSTNPW
jgi:uncharacterized membrane protein